MPAEVPDMILKRHDTAPNLKTTLKQVNPETKAEEAINLATALKVTCLLKPPTGSTVEIPCTAWGGGAITTSTGAKAGQVEVPWAQTTLSEEGTWKVEYEIEWPENAAKVKQFQTVPNEGYRNIQVVADLGVA
jgi:hypothetical protein